MSMQPKTEKFPDKLLAQIDRHLQATYKDLISKHTQETRGIEAMWSNNGGDKPWQVMTNHIYNTQWSETNFVILCSEKNTSLSPNSKEASFLSAVANFYGKTLFSNTPFSGCFGGVSDCGIIDSYCCPTTSSKAVKLLSWDVPARLMTQPLVSNGYIQIYSGI